MSVICFGYLCAALGLLHLVVFFLLLFWSLGNYSKT